MYNLNTHLSLVLSSSQFTPTTAHNTKLTIHHSSTSSAAPVADASADIEARDRGGEPFKIIVSSPHRQTLVPEYTLCNGRITSNEADAARYSIAYPALGVLFCQDSKSSTTSQLIGNIGFTKTLRDFAVYDGKKGIYSTWFVKDGKVMFRDPKDLGFARWILSGGEGGEKVQANFGGLSTQDFIPADLTAVFIEAKPSMAKRSEGELHARRAIPFKIIVSSPHRQTLVPEYMLCNGKITSIAANAAQYYFSDTPPFGVLYCSDPSSSTTSQLSGKLGFSATARDFAVYTGQCCGYYDKFSLGTDKQLNKVKFQNAALGKAKWVLRGGEGGEKVQADFGSFSTQYSIPADLTAVFGETNPSLAKRSESELHARRALPFKLNVSFPNRQTLVAETPVYTLCNGKVTSTKEDAARYYFSDTSPLGLLYCSDAEWSTISQISGQMGFNKKGRDFAVYSGKKGIYSRFFLDDGKMQFNDERKFGFGTARWVLGEGGKVQACFGGLSRQDFSPVKLTAEFDL